MVRSLARRVFQLAFVHGHQWTIDVEEKSLCLGIKRQGIKLAAKRLGIPQRTTGVAKVFATVLDANAAQTFFLFPGERYFQRRKAGVHVAATLTRRAMIKQHVVLRRGCVVFLNRKSVHSGKNAT